MTTISVREVRLGRERLHGRALQDDRVIEIDPRLSERDRLETLIHEALHIIMPFLEEEAVDTAGAEIAEVLWSDGFRKGK